MTKVIVTTQSVTHRAGGLLDAVHDLFSEKSLAAKVEKVLSYKEQNMSKDLETWRNIPISLHKGGFLLYSRSLRDEALNSNADILDVEGLWRYPHLLMDTWKRHTGKPIVCSPHGMLDPYIIREQGKLKRIISNIFFQKALDSVSCWRALCKAEMDDIRAYGQKEPVAIIPNGVHLPVNYHKTIADDGKKHLLYLGRLHPKKGVDLLLKAIVAIRKKKPGLLCNWHVDIVGWDHENTKAGLDKLIVEGEISTLVTMHGGVFGKAKEKLLSQSSAYILPSHGEGLPMSVLEAWSWHLPVIMTRECRIPEGFERKAAICIEDNVDSVVDGLIRLFFMSDDELHKMGDNGRILVETCFTWQLAAKKMIHLYDWLLGNACKPDFVYM